MKETKKSWVDAGCYLIIASIALGSLISSINNNSRLDSLEPKITGQEWRIDQLRSDIIRLNGRWRADHIPEKGGIILEGYEYYVNANDLQNNFIEVQRELALLAKNLGYEHKLDKTEPDYWDKIKKGGT